MTTTLVWDTSRNDKIPDKTTKIAYDPSKPKKSKVREWAGGVMREWEYWKRRGRERVENARETKMAVYIDSRV